jgi:hypothetical protein
VESAQLRTNVEIVPEDTETRQESAHSSKNNKRQANVIEPAVETEVRRSSRTKPIKIPAPTAYPTYAKKSKPGKAKAIKRSSTSISINTPSINPLETVPPNLEIIDLTADEVC